MKVKQLLIIPKYEEIEEFLDLAREYHAGFEYNDFFLPGFLDQEAQLEERIAGYEALRDARSQTGEYPSYCTMHGVFLDITVFSDDEKIRKASDERIHQSMEIAKRLGVRGVVFHTNYVVNFLQENYRTGWVKKNEAYFRALCQEYPTIEVYMENMFDFDPVLLGQLAEAMKDVDNFGICFDYAHAHVFGQEDKIEEWIKTLAPYVKHLHINDNNFIIDSHEALGNGKIDWKRFQHYYETYFPNASVLIEVTGKDKVKASLEFLTGLS